MNSSLNTLGTLCEFIKNELNGLYPEREIQNLTDMIISHTLGIPKHEIHIEKGKMIDEVHKLRIIEMVNELRLGKPVQYIIGYTDFFGLNLRVSPDVLIPRPETEELVKWIIDDHAERSPVILDIGTGSGCIAIALKKNLPQSEIHACDVSPSSLTLARKNARSQKVDINFFHHDISSNSLSESYRNQTDNYSGINKTQGIHFLYDIIVSNPPYIPLKEKPLMNVNITGFEPENALFVPDEDPLIFYRNIANFGLNHLKKNGQIYFEIHEKSGQQVKRLLEGSGYRDINIRKDINGKIRMIKCTNNG
jgi:release factor glutamine methyltransferase